MRVVPIVLTCFYSFINAGVISSRPNIDLFFGSTNIEIVEKSSTSFPKIYLLRKGLPFNATYSFGYSLDGPFTGIGIFGYKLRREIKIVPEANTSMKAYAWTGASSLVLIAGGICLMAGSAVARRNTDRDVIPRNRGVQPPHSTIFSLFSAQIIQPKSSWIEETGINCTLSRKNTKRIIP